MKSCLSLRLRLQWAKIEEIEFVNIQLKTSNLAVSSAI